MPEIIVDRGLDVPLHSQIAEPIRMLIESGDLPPGTRLEDEVSLAARLRVSRPTARRALETLTNRGLIMRKRGVGTQVTPSHVHRSLVLSSLNEDLRHAGKHPRTMVLEWEQQPAMPWVASALAVAEGADVVSFRRLRMADDEPLAILSNWLPADLAPSRDALETIGLYEALRERGVTVSAGVQRFAARLATTEEARLLNEPPGAALLTLQRTASDAQNRVIELGQHVYRASRYSYETTVFA